MHLNLSEANYVFQLTRDHNTMTDVLFGRNLRLKVALTLWQRNVGELLTYFLRCVPGSCFQTCAIVCLLGFPKYGYIIIFVQNPRQWGVC